MNKDQEILNVLEQFNKGIIVDNIKADRLILKKQDTKELESYIKKLKRQLKKKENALKDIEELIKTRKMYIKSFDRKLYINPKYYQPILNIIERSKNGKTNDF